MVKIEKILKFLSRSFASLLFTIAFFLLFTSVFGNSLIENLPALESSLKNEFFSSDILLEQLSKEQGLKIEEIKKICEQNPAQEGCKQINNPALAAEPAIKGIKDQIIIYQPILDNLMIPMIITFALSLLFYFLGTMSIYAALFKISLNALISAALGYVAFSSFPSFLPEIVDQAFNLVSADISQEITVGFKQGVINVMNSWLQIPLSELNTLLIYMVVVSLPASILFYFLKRKEKNNS